MSAGPAASGGALRSARHVTAHLVEPSRSGGTDPLVHGARVGFGEDPAEVARRAAGLASRAPLASLDVRTEITTVADPGTGEAVALHIDRVCFAAPAAVPAARRARWYRRCRPSAADLLGQQDTPPSGAGRPRLRRFASYALATDPAGRILLSKIAPGFPGAGTWHLPGGGVDQGEDARTALDREIFEETGQSGRIGGLITIASHHRAGEEGADIYAVWVFFRVHVPEPCLPCVNETGGSTIDCGWFAPEDLAGIRLSTTARRGLGALEARSGADPR